AIYISGGGSLLPGLKKYMEIHTGIPVHYASDLITATKANKSVDNKAFAFLLNAYTATFREVQS
ncbi:MAG: rod shape-determining protein, partial [Eubacteriales bacterium]|nr:rod shape-determining protein [Eubacteriales bacterium]